MRAVIVVIILLVLYSDAYSLNITKDSLSGLAQAYGFIVAQEESLKHIANNFPELSRDVEISRASFDMAFPKIEEKIKKELVRAGSQDVYAKVLEKFKNEISSSAIEKKDAIAFLEEVKRRAKGNIFSPALEYMLAVQYADRPSAEFSDGYKKHYSTSGHPKSLGVRLNMDIPISWRSAEGARPHIVQKWISENGSGIAMITLEIRDASGIQPTKKEVQDFVNSGEVKTIIPDGAKYVSSGTFTVEGVPGFWVQMWTVLERVDVKIKQKSIMYQVFFDGKAIGFMCHSGGIENDSKKIEASFDRNLPLCKSILNSFVLEQKY